MTNPIDPCISDWVFNDLAKHSYITLEITPLFDYKYLLIRRQYNYDPRSDRDSYFRLMIQQGNRLLFDLQYDDEHIGKSFPLCTTKGKEYLITTSAEDVVYLFNLSDQVVNEFMVEHDIMYWENVWLLSDDITLVIKLLEWNDVVVSKWSSGQLIFYDLRSFGIIPSPTIAMDNHLCDVPDSYHDVLIINGNQVKVQVMTRYYPELRQYQWDLDDSDISSSIYDINYTIKHNRHIEYCNTLAFTMILAEQSVYRRNIIDGNIERTYHYEVDELYDRRTETENYVMAYEIEKEKLP